MAGRNRLSLETSSGRGMCAERARTPLGKAGPQASRGNGSGKVATSRHHHREAPTVDEDPQHVSARLEEVVMGVRPRDSPSRRSTWKPSPPTACVIRSRALSVFVCSVVIAAASPFWLAVARRSSTANTSPSRAACTPKICSPVLITSYVVPGDTPSPTVAASPAN